MENYQENRYLKRTQKDYTMSFKLQVVQEIERGELLTYLACRKYGIQARSTIVHGSENLVTLIGKIKHHQTCQNLQNKKL